MIHSTARLTASGSRLVAALVVLFALSPAGLLAQQQTAAATPADAGAAADKADLAKQTQNPIASLITVPFQNNTNFGVGDTRRVQNLLNIQPVVPFALSDNLTLVTRAIIPVLRQPIGLNDSISGLGDVNLQTFFVPKLKTKGIMVGAGPAFGLRTETDEALGSGRWTAGPSAVIVAMPGKFVVGALYQQLFSFAGDKDRGAVNSMLFQYFINYNLADGWAISSAPSLIANWKAKGGERWTIPFGGGIAKVFSIGKRHYKVSVAAYANVVHPTGAPDTQLQATWFFLFPK